MMNSPQQTRALLAYLAGHTGDTVSVQLHGSATITGTLTETTVDGGGGATITMLRITTTAGPVWQIDPATVIAAAV